MVSRPATVACLALAALGASTCRLDSETGTGLRITWRVPLTEAAAGWRGRPGVFQGAVIGQTGGAVSAFDVRTGARVWTTTLRMGVPLGADNVAVAAGRAFAAGGDSVYALNAASGRRLWAFLPDAQAALCEIAADSDAVYVGTRSHHVYAISADSGHAQWSVDVGPDWAFFGTVEGIATSGDTVYVAATQELSATGDLRRGHIIALDRRTGAELWHYTSPGERSDVNAAPLVTGRYLVANDLYGGSIIALDRFEGAEVWRVRTQGIGPSRAPQQRDAVLFAGANDNYAYAIDLASGAVRWTASAGASIRAVALCGERMVANSQRIEVFAVSSGEHLGTVSTPDDAGLFTSDFAVVGNRLAIFGSDAVYGLSCPP